MKIAQETQRTQQTQKTQGTQLTCVVCVVGLGYVGFPLAQSFSRSCKVIGFDTNPAVIARHQVPAAVIAKHEAPASVIASEARQSEESWSLRGAKPRGNLQQSPKNSMNLLFTGDPVKISEADYIIICVPTPVTKSKEPDLSYVRSAAETIGRNMKKGAVVVLESTVYPGVTEEVVMPILEKESGFKCGEGFRIAYSPERINPGDEEHAIERITKVVAGMDEKTTDEVASLYSRVAANVFQARDIKTAEAAKVIENIQRDLNIALMNELSIIFEKMGLSTRDVIDAAATKWNFQVYSPGLIGGHCIPVDPYYLVYKARELGYHPQVILAGRAINDSMPGHVAEMTIKALNSVGKVIKGSCVLIMGLTYKENVADTRETPVKEMIKALKEYGVSIYGYDPLLNDIEQEFGIKSYDPRLLIPDSVLSTPDSRLLTLDSGVDAVIVAVAHDAFHEITLDKLKTITNARPVLIDVREMFDAEQAKERGFYYQTL